MSPNYSSWESFLLVAINNNPDNLAWIQSAVQNFMQVGGMKLFWRLQALLWDTKINDQHLSLSELKRKISSSSLQCCLFVLLIFGDWCRFQLGRQNLDEKNIIRGLPENNHQLSVQGQEDTEKCIFIYIILYNANTHIHLSVYRYSYYVQHTLYTSAMYLSIVNMWSECSKQVQGSSFRNTCGENGKSTTQENSLGLMASEVWKFFFFL